MMIISLLKRNSQEETIKDIIAIVMISSIITWSLWVIKDMNKQEMILDIQYGNKLD
jgi:hypothetical protein